MFLTILFWVTFVFNCLITTIITISFLKKKINVIYFMNKIYPTIYDKFYALYFLSVLYVRQWLQKNVIKINKNEYELHHVIEGAPIKLRLKRVIPKIIDVRDCVTNESYEGEIINEYLKFKQIFPLEVKVNYFYEDGTISNE